MRPLTPPPPPPTLRRPAQAGATLIEVLVTVMIVAIVVSVAVPSFKYVTTSNRISAEANGLLGDLQFARGEAIKEGQTVTVCASSTGTTCSGASNWATGWIVFADANGNQTVDPGETIFRHQAAFTSTDTFTGVAVPAVTFNREGFAVALGGAALITLHDTTSNPQWTRCVSISLIGLTVVERAGTGTCV